MTETKNSTGTRILEFLKNNMMYPVIVALIIIFSATGGTTFLSVNNFINILNQVSYLIVIGVGITFIMLSGALDLSIGYQVAVVSVSMGLMASSGVPSPLIVILGIALSVLLSTINGSIYAFLKVFPFIITLATQYIFYGSVFLLSGSRTMTDYSDGFKVVGQYRIPIPGTSYSLPLAILLMIVIVIIGSFILNRTYFGRNIYALGSNPDAVALSGVSVAKMRIGIFALAGVFIGIGAYMLTARVGTASGNTGNGDEFFVMAGAMLGGIKMGGGGGKMSNMVVGVITLQIINNGMNLLGITTFWQNIAMGVILLIAITISELQSRSVVKQAKTVAGTPPTDSDAEKEKIADKSAKS